MTLTPDSAPADPEGRLDWLEAQLTRQWTILKELEQGGSDAASMAARSVLASQETVLELLREFVAKERGTEEDGQ